MAELEFTVPGKGKPKGRAKRTTKHGLAFIPKETRNAEALVKLTASQALGGRALLRGPLHLTMVATFAIPTGWPKWKRTAAELGWVRPTVTPDWDNLGKLISDGLNGIAYADDKAIVVSHVEKRYGERAQTWVHLAEIEPAEDAELRRRVEQHLKTQKQPELAAA